MTLDSFARRRVGSLLTWAATHMAGGRISPNALTWLSLVLSALCALALYLSRDSVPMLLLALVLLVAAGLADALDGAAARMLHREGRRGDFLDHVIDRYSDVLILCGAIFGGYVPMWLGVVALTGVLLTSYMGVQAQAVRLERVYGGLMGSADRLVVLILAISLNVIYPHELLGLLPLGWGLAVVGVLSHITAVQRFYCTLRRLEE